MFSLRILTTCQNFVHVGELKRYFVEITPFILPEYCASIVTNNMRAEEKVTSNKTAQPETHQRGHKLAEQLVIVTPKAHKYRALEH